ncbi:uncharacterized protein LOC129976458 [Argiope bruennichi]|uniref:Uncharacterized protein n=1 Tax=Argiope bruennichi TaxID=94029 RepID=A0A8T0E2X6_ARGBR|nr:uncharacterized protein LOC129976458 [Argiope bruennichi]KAF8764696.1 hypothetical protein HNY73_022749 [Argiope bruennichi]
MQVQIITILLVAVVCCSANNFGFYGVSYAPNSVAPYNAYAPAYNPAATVKVTYVIPSDVGNYVVVSDVAGAAPAATYAVADPSIEIKDAVARYIAPAATYAVADPSIPVKDGVARYIAPLRSTVASSANIAYIVKK